MDFPFLAHGYANTKRQKKKKHRATSHSTAMVTYSFYKVNSVVFWYLGTRAALRKHG